MLIRQTVLPVTLPVTFPPRASIFSFKALRFSKWFRLPVITKDCPESGRASSEKVSGSSSTSFNKSSSAVLFFSRAKIHKRTCDDWSYAIHRRQLFCRCSEHFAQIIFIFPTNHPCIGNSDIRDSKAVNQACKICMSRFFNACFEILIRFFAESIHLYNRIPGVCPDGTDPHRYAKSLPPEFSSVASESPSIFIASRLTNSVKDLIFLASQSGFGQTNVSVSFSFTIRVSP